MTTTRYECIVDGCDWHYDEPPLADGRIAVNLAAYGRAASLADALANRQATETALRTHLESHDSIEWARTVNRLQTALDKAGEELRRIDSRNDPAHLQRILGTRPSVPDPTLPPAVPAINKIEE